MKRLLCLMLLLACPTALLAQDCYPMLVVYPDGTAALYESKGATPKLIKHVLLPPTITIPPGNPGDGGGGNPPNNGDDPPVGSIEEKVSILAKSVNDPGGAKVLSAAFRTLAQSIEQGKIPTDTDSVDKAMTAVINATIAMLPENKDDWNKVYKGGVHNITIVIGQQVLANGGTMNRDEWNKLLTQVADGLDNAAGPNSALPDWVQDLITALLPVLIQLITRLFGA